MGHAPCPSPAPAPPPPPAKHGAAGRGGRGAGGAPRSSQAAWPGSLHRSLAGSPAPSSTAQVDGATLQKVPERPASTAPFLSHQGGWLGEPAASSLRAVGRLRPSRALGTWQEGRRRSRGLRACTFQGHSTPGQRWTTGRDPPVLWGPQHAGHEGSLLPAPLPRSPEEAGLRQGSTRGCAQGQGHGERVLLSPDTPHGPPGESVGRECNPTCARGFWEVNLESWEHLQRGDLGPQQVVTLSFRVGSSGP